MNISHRIALDPSKKQRQAFIKAAGVARFVWNWGLTEWEAQYKAGKRPTGYSLKKEWNAIKGEEFPWVYESPKDANSQPFANLQQAYINYRKSLAKIKKRGKLKLDYERPKLKKRGRRDSFYIANSETRVSNKKIRLPKIGWVKLRERLRFTGRIMSVTVSRTADRWFASIAVDVGDDYARSRIDNKIIGIDLGLTHTTVLSDGRKFNAPKPLKKALKQLRRFNKSFSRKANGSNRKAKAARKIARLYAQTANIRNDFLHKVTTQLCRESQTIVIEDLNVSGMMKNRCFSRAISDIGFYEFRRQLTYKAELHGVNLIIADRFFPSSKKCSVCGYKKDKLTLGERVYKCEECGAVLDRDLNAALNLRNLAVGFTAFKHRGEVVRPKALPGRTSVKRKLTTC